MGGLGGRSPPNREAGVRLEMGGLGGRSPPRKKVLKDAITLPGRDRRQPQNRTSTQAMQMPDVEEI